MATKRVTEHVVFDTSVVRHHVDGTHHGPMLDRVLRRGSALRFHVATTTLYELHEQLLREELPFDRWRAAAPFWRALIDPTEPVLPYPGPPSLATPIDPALHARIVWRHLIEAESFAEFERDYVARDDDGAAIGTITFTDVARRRTEEDRARYYELVDRFVASCERDEDKSQAALIRCGLAHVRRTRGEEAARRGDAFWRVIACIASMRMSKTSPYELRSHPNDFIDLSFLQYLERVDVTLCLEDRAMRARMEQAQILDLDRVHNIPELVAAVAGAAVAA